MQRENLKPLSNTTSRVCPLPLPLISSTRAQGDPRFGRGGARAVPRRHPTRAPVARAALARTRTHPKPLTKPTLELCAYRNPMCNQKIVLCAKC